MEVNIIELDVIIDITTKICYSNSISCNKKYYIKCGEYKVKHISYLSGKRQ